MWTSYRLTCSFLVLFFAVLTTAGCGAGSSTGPQAGAPAAPSAAPTGASQRSAAEIAAVYEAAIAAPGVAGRDYDPWQALVLFNDGPLPALPASLIAPASVAASLPNAMLRQQPEYAPVADAIATRYGLRILRQVYLESIHMASFQAPAGVDLAVVLPRLRREFAGQVAFALYNPLVHAHYTPNDPDYLAGPDGVLWDRWKIRCGEAWDATLGDPSVIIADVDTGVRRTHVELVGHVIDVQTEYPSAHCDLVENDNDPQDEHGHGTFISGIIVAEIDNNFRIAGVAPHCRLLPIRISADGTSTVADMAAGCLLADTLGAKVINISFGTYSDKPVLEQMVNTLTAHGKLLVSSAGNDGVTETCYPAGYENAISVGATDNTDACAWFSNRGSTLDIAAPGDPIKSCGYFSDQQFYSNQYGTSYSAPMVAAAAGLLWSYRPALSVAEVRQALLNHGAATTGFTQAIPRLDIRAALDAVSQAIIPSAAGITLAPDGVYGLVPAVTTFDVALVDPVNVVRVEYTIDLPPFGDGGAGDVTVESTTAPDFALQLDVQTCHNAAAQVSAKYFSSSGDSGTVDGVPLTIFNQRGDVNCDGVVDLADLAAYTGLLGTVQGAPGYTLFLDSDIDGVITEADAGAVGYFFSAP